MVDRFGKCPHCGKNWKGKDMLEEISKLSAFTHLDSTSLLNIAKTYGYTLEEKDTFSTVNVFIKESGVFYQCPSIRCNHVFNAESGEEFASMWHLKQGIIFVQDKEEDSIPST